MARGGTKYYAVAVGSEGPKVYTSWQEAEKATSGFPGAKHKSFKAQEEAEDWIGKQAIQVKMQPSSQAMITSSQCVRDETSARDPGMQIPSSSSTSTSTTAGRYSSQSQSSSRYSPYPSSKPILITSSPEFATPAPSRRSLNPLFGALPPYMSMYPSVNLAPLEEDMQVGKGCVPVKQEAGSPLSEEGEAKPMTRQLDGPLGMALDVYTEGRNCTPAQQLVHGKVEGEDIKWPNLASISASSDIPSGSLKGKEREEAKPPVDSLEDHEPALSTKQQEVLDKVMRGQSIFITGSAGTGKSVLSRAIIRALRKRYSTPLEVAVTATTGIAATNIGGATLHSWAGVGLGKQSIDKLYGIVLNKKNKVYERWNACKALLIDEVSMLDASFFDTLEALARMVRKNDRPFGGIQLIITGDFYQLPPVPELLPGQTGQRRPATFVFQSKHWQACIPETITLTEVFRQKDAEFVKILNEVRLNQMSKESISRLCKLNKTVKYKDGIEPTHILPTRREVLSSNTARLRALKAESKLFEAKDASGIAKDGTHLFYPDASRLRDFLDKNTMVEKELELKVGAQVMLVKNMQDKGLVNGSIGRIVSFTSQEAILRAQAGEDASLAQTNAPTYAEDMGYDNMPDAMENDISGELAQGGGPDALNFNPADVSVAQVALTEKELRRKKNMPEDYFAGDAPPGDWPVVQFGKGGLTLLPPVAFDMQNTDGIVEATRTQVPLILAWALSIHKSQGQTLERVKVDLGKAFEAGQGYVALSRATQLSTLELYNFQPSKIRVHKAVVAWHTALEAKQTED